MHFGNFNAFFKHLTECWNSCPAAGFLVSGMVHHYTPFHLIISAYFSVRCSTSLSWKRGILFRGGKKKACCHSKVTAGKSLVKLNTSLDSQKALGKETLAGAVRSNVLGVRTWLLHGTPISSAPLQDREKRTPHADWVWHIQTSDPRLWEEANTLHLAQRCSILNPPLCIKNSQNTATSPVSQRQKDKADSWGAGSTRAPALTVGGALGSEVRTAVLGDWNPQRLGTSQRLCFPLSGPMSTWGGRRTTWVRLSIWHSQVLKTLLQVWSLQLLSNIVQTRWVTAKLWELYNTCRVPSVYCALISTLDNGFFTSARPRHHLLV